MPPPGFNHMNAFGFGVPRAQSSSKVLPFMNAMGNASQLQQQTNNWAQQQSQPQNMGYQQPHEQNQGHMTQPNLQTNKSGKIFFFQ